MGASILQDKNVLIFIPTIILSKWQESTVERG
jgi:hypothetical protein